MNDKKITQAGLHGEFGAHSRFVATDRHGGMGVAVPVQDPYPIKALSLGDIKRKLLESA